MWLKETLNSLAWSTHKNTAWEQKSIAKCSALASSILSRTSQYKYKSYSWRQRNRKKEGNVLIATAIASHGTPPKRQYWSLQVQEHETSAKEQELEDNKVKTLLQGLWDTLSQSLCDRVESCKWKADCRIANGRPSRPARVLPKLVVFQCLVPSCTSQDTGGIMSCCLELVSQILRACTRNQYFVVCISCFTGPPA